MANQCLREPDIIAIHIWLFNFYENLKTLPYIKAGYSSEKINIHYYYLYGWKTVEHMHIFQKYTLKNSTKSK